MVSVTLMYNSATDVFALERKSVEPCHDLRFIVGPQRKSFDESVVTPILLYGQLSETIEAQLRKIIYGYNGVVCRSEKSGR